jgi:hypothetical protein
LFFIPFIKEIKNSILLAIKYSAITGTFTGVLQPLPFLMSRGMWVYLPVSLGVFLSSATAVFCYVYFLYWFQPGLSTLEDLLIYLEAMARPLVGFSIVYFGCTLLFAIWYLAIYEYSSQYTERPFIGTGLPSKPTLVDFIYFSAVTIATLGYGDITPNYPIIKLLVSIEVICGVGFVTVGIAIVIAYIQPIFDRLSKRNKQRAP